MQAIDFTIQPRSVLLAFVAYVEGHQDTGFLFSFQMWADEQLEDKTQISAKFKQLTDNSRRHSKHAPAPHKSKDAGQ